MTFEDKIHQDIHQYLVDKGFADPHMPECPDVEAEWERIGAAYLPDGIREFNGYPTVSLGWMMLIGMAVAKMWDTGWETYKKTEQPYETLRDKRGYDHTDEYILQEVLALGGDDERVMSQLAGDTAERVYGLYLHQRFEPATPEAFRGYVACLRQLYLMGMAVELKALGYRMSRVE
ncbi:MAG: hypothetical protein ACI3Y5_04855 [Prevotella sp.]